MELIDKSALVAEIERLHKEHSGKWGCDEVGVNLEHLEDFLDTIEVKEMDLETSIDDYINSHFTEGCDGGMVSDWYKVLGGVHYKDLMELAKHFFELGISVSNKAQKGE